MPPFSPSSILLRRRLLHSLFSFTSLRRTSCLSVSSFRQPPENGLRTLDAPKKLSTSSSALRLNSDAPTHLLTNQALGFVAAAQANFMRVIVESAGGAPATTSTIFPGDPRVGGDLLCVVRALLKKIKRRVLVGDRVLVGSVDWVDRRGVVEDVFERVSEIADPPVANADHLLVLFSMDQPKPEPFTLTKFLVEAESTGIPVSLVFNKMELVGEETVTLWREKLNSWGYRPLFCSVDRKLGLGVLEDLLKGRTSVIVGPSGVGKSSLINTLRSTQYVSSEEEMTIWLEHIHGSKWFGNQRVGAVSKRSGKGKHTTGHVSLLPLSSGGFLADTPGFDQPSLLKVTKRTLQEMFPEIRIRLITTHPLECSFKDCLHLGEPGCVVKSDWERYPCYFQLVDEVGVREEFQLRTFGKKREGEVRYKVGEMGAKQAEPRLEPKKHRRISRKRLNQSILNDLDDDLMSAKIS